MGKRGLSSASKGDRRPCCVAVYGWNVQTWSSTCWKRLRKKSRRWNSVITKIARFYMSPRSRATNNLLLTYWTNITPQNHPCGSTRSASSCFSPSPPSHLLLIFLLLLLLFIICLFLRILLLTRLMPFLLPAEHNRLEERI